MLLQLVQRNTIPNEILEIVIVNIIYSLTLSANQSRKKYSTSVLRKSVVQDTLLKCETRFELHYLEFCREADFGSLENSCGGTDLGEPHYTMLQEDYFKTCLFRIRCLTIQLSNKFQNLQKSLLKEQRQEAQLFLGRKQANCFRNIQCDFE